MNKKTIILAGASIAILSLGVGVFLFLNEEAKKTEEEALYTKWSQEGDYEIEETAGQSTIVTNAKAGFSFEVPMGWKVEKELFSETEFFVTLLSPDAIRNELGPPISEGCGIGLNTFFREDLWEFYSNSIVGFQTNLQNRPKEDEVINIGSYEALKTVLISETDEIRKRIGDNIQVRVPIANNGVIEFGMTIMPKHQSNCLEDFETFISRFSIS